MEPGRVIEFIEEGKFFTGLVTRVKGSKLLAITETDREISVSSGRVLHNPDHCLDPAQPRHALVQALREISGRRQTLSREINLTELWELLEGEGEEFSFDFLAELAWSGPIGPDHVSAARRAVFYDGLYFKMRPGGAERHGPEKVEQIVLTRTREEERERELAEVGTWLAQVWSGAPENEPDDRDRVIKILRDIAVYGPEAPEYKWGLKLLERAGLGGDPWRPFDLLIKMGEMGRHENLDLIRHDVPLAFSEAALAQAAALARDQVWLDEDRRDLTHLEVITADSGGARDFDDAVSLEMKDDRLIVGVHIADVAAVVQPGTTLDQEARNRATSIYMPDLRLTMLPDTLSEECLSLKQGLIRPAFSLLAEMTESGEVLSFEFAPSLITVKRQLTYQEVDEAVHHDLLLGRLLALSRELKARRVAGGAMIMPLPKLNVYLTPEGEIGVNLTLWDNPGRAMITEFMILANHLAARLLTDRGAACLYRTQDEPAERLVDGGTDCRDLFPCLQQRRFLNRVDWSLEPKPHSSMGMDVYTYISSPLRRYVDLAVQRQLRSLVRTGRPAYSPEETGEILTQVEPVIRQALRIQNNRRRYWLLRFFETLGPKVFEALVLEKLPYRWRIFLPELMLDADLPPQTGLDLVPGQTFNIRVKKVQARAGVLKFEPA